jgi:hypothetical protein
MRFSFSSSYLIAFEIVINSFVKGHAVSVSEKDSSRSDMSKPWITGTVQIPSGFSTDLPNHIIPARDCNHGAELVWGGRVNLAHSLQEVVSYLGDNSTSITITVALTLGNIDAQAEIVAYVTSSKILSVKRSEKQCISCACKVAHITSAVLVIA